ncbi:MAG TPA: CocE/NonD family hydrolase [Euzebyales bacterium]|nr:CocE/NonD family hydrolase [Euzebyales bacterium]
MGRTPSTARPILLERDVDIPLRDGVRSRADVWRPADGAAGPAILVRTPYGREDAVPTGQIDPRLAADRGYAVVAQDVRGRGGSDGDFEPYVAEADDGHDSVEWVAAQPWCDGRVVMAGMSYVGLTQWLAASAAPPSLVAIAPALSSDTAGEGWSFCNGVLERGFLSSWVVSGLAPPEQQWLDRIDDVLADPQLAVTLAPWSKHWFTEPAAAPYWQARSVDPSGPAHAVPKLSIGGWYDIFLAATLRAHARGRNPWDRLILGPWGHDRELSHLVGDRNLGGAGPGEVFGVARRTLDFYDAVLAGGEPDLPPVSAYVLGADRWVALPSWPPPDARPCRLTLGSGVFTVVAEEPPPARGGRGLVSMVPGRGFGPRDQRPLADRGDVLALSLPALDPGSVLAGPATARLRVAPGVGGAGAGARDWVVTLCLQCPDGRWDNLTEGIARVAADRDEVVVPLGDVCVAAPAGARLIVLVAGASYPRWDQAGAPGPRVVREGSTVELTLADV